MDKQSNTAKRETDIFKIIFAVIIGALGLKFLFYDAFSQRDYEAAALFFVSSILFSTAICSSIEFSLLKKVVIFIGVSSSCALIYFGIVGSIPFYFAVAFVVLGIYAFLYKFFSDKQKIYEEDDDN